VCVAERQKENGQQTQATIALFYCSERLMAIAWHMARSRICDCHAKLVVADRLSIHRKVQLASCVANRSRCKVQVVGALLRGGVLELLSVGHRVGIRCIQESQAAIGYHLDLCDLRRIGEHRVEVIGTGRNHRFHHGSVGQRAAYIIQSLIDQYCS
jgi:hypothetical protein